MEQISSYGTVIGEDLRTDLEFPTVPVQDMSALRGKYTPAPEVTPEAPLMDAPTWIESMGASAELTITKALWNSYEGMKFTAAPDFDYMAAVKADEATYGTVMPTDKIEFLKSSSPEEYQYRSNLWDEAKFAEQTAAAHPTAFFAGQLAFDPVATVAGIGAGKAALVGAKAANLSTAGARVAGAAVSSATEAGMAYAATKGTPAENETIVYAAIGGALGGLFLDVKSFPKYQHTEGILSDKVKIPQTIKNFQSLYDEVKEYNSDLANKFFGDFTKNSGNSASAMSRNIQADQGRMLVPMEQVLEKHNLVPKFAFGKNANAVRTIRDEKLSEANLWLNRQYQAEVNDGTVLAPHPDPIVRELVDAYTESGFALKYLERAQNAGRDIPAYTRAGEYDELVALHGDAGAAAIMRKRTQEGMAGTDMVRPSKYYVPINHDYNKIRRLIDNIGVEAVADAYGRQLLKHLPEALMDKDLIRNVGAGFLEIAQGGKKGDVEVKAFFKGRKAEEIQVLKDQMLAAGMDNYSVERVLGKGLQQDPATAIGQTATHLRTRFNWDLDEVLDKRSGTTFGDLLNGDLYGNLNRYNLQMSSRIGLASVGFKNGASLNTAFDSMVDTAVAKGMSRDKAAKLADHVEDTVLGNPLGEDISNTMRNLTSIAQMLHLAKSGIYNIGDYAIVAWDQGVLRTAKAFVKTLPTNSLKNLTVQEAENLSDIVSGRMIADGRIRPMVTLFEDNFDCIDSRFTEGVQYSAQYVRFANGSEQIRRHQAKMYGSLIMDTIDKDLKANGEYLTSLGMSGKDIASVRDAISTYGWDMNRWDLRVSDTLSNYALSAADNTVLTIRKGERPKIMDSQVGKIIFAYQSFVFGAHNKILRRAFRKDGAVGVAALLALQIPLATIAGMTSNIVDGKEPTDDLGNVTTKAMSSLGLFGWLKETLNQSEIGSNVTALAPLNAAGTVAKKTANGTLQPLDVVKAVPMLGILPPVRALVAAIQED